MIFSKPIHPDKRCFVYCGPERCDCGAGNRWEKQTTFFDPEDQINPNKGNCTEAAVASLLGVPVPEKFGKSGDVMEFWDDFYACFARYGFTVIRENGNYCHDGLYLASGPSSRGCSHMVVMRGRELVHDPHPSNEGIQSIEHVWIAVPIDPFSAVAANYCLYGNSPDND